MNDVLTVPFSLCGLPCVSLPVQAPDFDAVGMQVVGGRLNEDVVLKVASVLESVDD